MLVPGDVDRPVTTGQRAVGVEPHGGAGRLETRHPAADRQPGAAQTVAVLAAAGRHASRFFQSGCSASRASTSTAPLLPPRLAVGHQVASALQVAQPVLGRVEAELCAICSICESIAKIGLRRERRAIGGDAGLVGQHLEAADVEVRATDRRSPGTRRSSSAPRRRTRRIRGSSRPRAPCSVPSRLHAGLQADDDLRRRACPPPALRAGS